MTLLSTVLVLALSADPTLTTLLKGPLTPQTIKDVIHEHRSEVKRCAEKRPKARQQVSGKLVVHFLIGMDGRLTDVKTTSSSVQEPALEACLLEAVRAFQFPKPKHTRVEVNFPFLVGPASKNLKGASGEDKAPDESEPDVLK